MPRSNRFAGPLVTLAVLLFLVVRALPTAVGAWNSSSDSDSGMDSRSGIIPVADHGPTESSEPEPIDFNRQIRPLLAQNCFACHGPDEEARQGWLGLHDRELATGELFSGQRGIVPGDSQASEVYRRITSVHEYERMPPPSTGHELSDEEIAIIKQWIEEGAVYDEHWSFRPITPPVVPQVQQADWVRNPIDAFVLQHLEQVGLEPASPASREKLIRRLSLDLIGLPPTPEEIEEFTSDDRPDAYEQLVDRLLASPRFGEHWARHWLDLARYADSQGYAQDELRTIWPYRDWLIRAINDDMPFDQFTLEQLAGDLLEQPATSQLIATGFHRNTMTNTEGGVDTEEFRYAAVVDRVNTTGQVWLGLTVGCAQCHSHRYDPITHDDYYRLLAIFNQTADNNRPDNAPNIPYLTDQQQAELKELQQQLTAVTEFQIERPDELQRLTRELGDIQRRISSITPYQTPVMRELNDESRRTTNVAIRGSHLNPGDEVGPGLPEFLNNAEVNVADRLELANWLTSRDNPLTARVEANRIWEQIFGVGIVETSEDFGTQGSLPTHPELLDWLANHLIESGWSRKQLCKVIAMSATYRQASTVTPRKLEIDPYNRLYSRAARYRLSAEQLRDYALAAGGILSGRMYGPPVRPPQPKLGLNAAFGGSLDWEPSAGEDRYRRGIYTLWRRTHPYPSFMALDATDRRVCTVRRTRTNSPVAALVTLNDPAFVEAAVAVAFQILDQPGEIDTNISFAYRLIVNRSPEPDERAVVEKLLESQLDYYRSDPAAAKELINVYEPVRELDDDDEDQAIALAAWTVVANTLLNLDEVLTRN